MTPRYYLAQQTLIKLLWNDKKRLFRFAYLPPLITYVRDSLGATPYAHLADDVATAITPAIYLLAESAEDGFFSVGASKVGGRPDLNQPWPIQDGKALYFLAQFNLTELAPHDADQLFPQGGLLSFFLGRRAIEGELESKNFTVLYATNLTGLKRAAWPDTAFEDSEYRVPTQRIEFRAS